MNIACYYDHDDVYRRIGGLEIGSRPGRGRRGVYRRIGGLEMPAAPGENATGVYRRIGGLEIEDPLVDGGVEVYRRIGGLEKGGDQPLDAPLCLPPHRRLRKRCSARKTAQEGLPPHRRLRKCCEQSCPSCCKSSAGWQAICLMLSIPVAMMERLRGRGPFPSPSDPPWR